MLTVKLVEPNGHEQIREVESVWTDPQDSGTVRALDPNTGNPIAFSRYGTLYVMNREGNTIARYALGVSTQKKQ